MANPSQFTCQCFLFLAVALRYRNVNCLSMSFQNTSSPFPYHRADVVSEVFVTFVIPFQTLTHSFKKLHHSLTLQLLVSVYILTVGIPSRPFRSSTSKTTPLKSVFITLIEDSHSSSLMGTTHIALLDIFLHNHPLFEAPLSHVAKRALCHPCLFERKNSNHVGKSAIHKWVWG